ncbi:DUF6205 family protein [Streptomyces chartreusis]|uniref:DUF6205 family protein n=1 Tax=Streptomyces chartreusis TaxID=1969 RepID=UPI003413DDAB
MGYTTHVTGEFAIEPPLTWPEIKDSPFAPQNVKTRSEPALILRVDEETADTADGPLLRRTASALVMRQIDEYRAHGLLDEVQTAVDAFAGHEWSGRLDCEGEESADLWRVIVRGGKAVRIDPQIVWPDD